MDLIDVEFGTDLEEQWNSKGGTVLGLANTAKKPQISIQMKLNKKTSRVLQVV